MAAQPPSRRLICLTGPESTGKTTLAEELAATLGVPLIAEVARTWLTPGESYGPDDVLAIARAQLAAETAALRAQAGPVIADTDLTVIQVWWEEKYGALDPWLAAALAAQTPRCYLLLAPDIPWTPDPLRESPHDRPRLMQRYRQIITGSGHPFLEIQGMGPLRIDRALRQVRTWLTGINRG